MQLLAIEARAARSRSQLHACSPKSTMSRREDDWGRIASGSSSRRAARIVETMEKRGLVGPSNGAKDREVLIDAL